jgi:molybdate transport system substrate-binding protein
MRFRFLAAAALAATLVTTGCGDNSSRVSTPAAGASSSMVTGKITVLAAASLTETFNRIGRDFEAANPGTTVTFSYAGSSALAQQITSGAPADVFASASPATMKTVTDAGDAIGTPAVFVKNQLVIAVPKGNPKGVKGLSDLTRPGVKVAECAKEVPCGTAAVTALAVANVKLTPVTLEQDVKSALSKVKLGEVDAALVYRTDARSDTADVDGIEFPESAKAINDYPIAALKGAPNPSGAAAFVAFVETPAEIKVLTDAGFQGP